MNGWTNKFYHDARGKVLGSVSEYNGQHKALLDGVFLGWFISEDHAQKAVEEAYEDTMEQRKFEDLL